MGQTLGGNMHGVMYIINEYKKIGGKITDKYMPLPHPSPSHEHY